MPNWCEGNIRLRGRRDAICRFLKEEIVCVTYDPRENSIIETLPLIEEDGDEIIIKNTPGLKTSTFYIKGTKRNFIDDGCNIYVSFREGCDEDTICIDGFKAAWEIRPEPYIDKSKKYGIDIKIVGFELGMEFMQTVEVSDGELIRNAETKFDDWRWDCPMPNMGG